MVEFAGQILDLSIFPILAATGHAESWIDDFGIVLAAAGIAVVIFHHLRLPVIFGYILTGILIGPHVFDKPLVEDANAIQQISELGIVFLLFFIGMEFDLKRLKRVFGPALLALIVQTLFMLYLGQVLAGFIGWNPTSTVFFGCLLAISSSMVTVKVLRDGKRMQEASTQFTIGILILEDILAVILLVILAGVALTQTFDWDAVWVVTFLMGIFVIMVFLIGRALVPRILIAICGDDDSSPEVLTLFSVGLVMGISMLALKLEFSPALGAFVAGTLLSQTQVAERVERLNRSLHDVFSAVFFVAIGMLLDPAILLANIGWIIGISILVVLFKVAAIWTGLCLAGQAGKTAFMAAVPKAQIGEFSFIIAGLGSSLGVLDEQVSGIAFGVALMTILFTPSLTKRSGKIFVVLLRLVPRRVKTLFRTYEKLVEGLFVGLGKSVILKLIRRPALQIILYFFLVNGIVISVSVGASWFFRQVVEWPMEWAWVMTYWLVGGLLVSPFLIAIVRNLNAVSFILTEALFSGKTSRPVYLNRLRQMMSAIILGAFIFVFMLIFLLVAAPYIPNTGIAGVAFLVVAAGVVFFRGRLILVNSQMEILFLESFHEEVASKEEQRREQILKMIQKQAPWQIGIVDLTLPVHAAWSGKRIRDLDLRSRFGVNILALGRKNSIVFDPGAEAPVFSGDRLVMSGSPMSIELVQKAMQEQVQPQDRPMPGPSQFRMEGVYLTPDSDLAGQTLAGGNIRLRYGITVIGVQREEERIANPAPDFLLAAGDVLMVAGLPEKIEAFAESCGEKPLPHGA